MKLKTFDANDLKRIVDALCTHIGRAQHEIWKREKNEEETQSKKNELRKLMNLMTKIDDTIPKMPKPRGKQRLKHKKVVEIIEKEERDDFF